MIVPMKRAYLFFLKKEESNALKKLRSLGTFHLDIEPMVNNSIEADQAEIKAAQKAAARLATIEKRSRTPDDVAMPQKLIKSRLNELQQLISDEEHALEDLAHCDKDLARLAPWGDFNPKDIAAIAEDGAQFELLLLGDEEYESLADLLSYDYAHWTLGKDENNRHCVALLIMPGRSRPEGLPKPVSLPEMGMSQLREKREKAIKKLARLKERMRSYLYLHASLPDYIATLSQRVEFESVREGLISVEESLVYASGYLPVDAVDILVNSAQRYGWGVMIREPEESDHVPTKLQQNFISRLINPVLSFLEVTPGYREVDVTGVFFTSFAVFVAMIMGDAAYGLLIVLAAIVLGLAVRANGTFIRMLLVLGMTTLIWGTLSGSWFSSYALANQPWLKQLSFWQLSNFPKQIFGKSPVEQQNFIMLICFTLAAIHLTIARLWNFVRTLPGVEAIAQLGITALIISLYQLVLFMVGISPRFERIYLYVLVGGFATMVIFGQQRKGQNFFVGLGKGFAGLFNAFLDTVGVFADIMSYVRLFAVGIASFSLASSFNDMGGGMIAKGGILIAVGIIVLVLGHVINFALGCLSVIVHAVRLNMLEFSSHIGIEWGGLPYSPFKEKKINL